MSENKLEKFMGGKYVLGIKIKFGKKIGIIATSELNEGCYNVVSEDAVWFVCPEEITEVYSCEQIVISVKINNKILAESSFPTEIFKTNDYSLFGIMIEKLMKKAKANSLTKESEINIRIMPEKWVKI